MSIPIRVPHPSTATVGAVNGGYADPHYVAAGGVVAPSPYYPMPTYHHYPVVPAPIDYDYSYAPRMAPRMMYNPAMYHHIATPIRPSMPPFTSIAAEETMPMPMPDPHTNHSLPPHQQHRERAASGTRTPIYVRCPKSDTVFRRRRLCEMPEEEIWRCPYPGCDKSFSKLSRSAISQHRKLIHPPMTQKANNQKKRSLEASSTEKPKEKKLKEEINDCDKTQQEMMMLANAAIYTSHHQNDDPMNHHPPYHHQPHHHRSTDWEKSNHPSDESDDDQSIDTPLPSIAATPLLTNSSISHSHSPPIRRAAAWIATNERSLHEKDDDTQKRIPPHHRSRPPSNFSTHATSTNALILSQ